MIINHLYITHDQLIIRSINHS